MSDKRPVKVITTIETKEGRFLNTRRQEVMVPEDATMEEVYGRLKEVEKKANFKFGRLHLPMVARVTLDE